MPNFVFCGSATLLVLVASLCLGYAQDNNQVKFSPGKTKLIPPDELNTEKPWEKKSVIPGFSGKASPPEVPTAYVPPSSSNPAALRSPAFLKFIDERQNWMFMTPELQNSSTEESLGLRDPETDKTSGKPKKAMERYFESVSRRDSPANNSKLDSNNGTNSSNSSILGESSAAGADSRSLSNQVSLPNSLGMSMSRGFDFNANSHVFNPAASALPGFNNNSTFESPSSSSFDFSTGFRKDFARQAELKRREEFRQLLQGPRPNPLPSGINDPINIWSDEGRRDLQPVTASGMGDMFGARNARNNILSGVPSADDLNRITRPSFLDDLNAKALGKDSLAPAVVAPSPLDNFRPKPTPFLMQMRKF